MKRGAKLSSEERRSAIILAIRRVFAQKGFHGTTTRELAEASGVSEALLFKHFPNKEALFSAMMKACCSEEDLVRFERLKALEPSAGALVLMVHSLVSLLLGRDGSQNEELAIQDRLILRSLAEDGEFARHVHAKIATNWIPPVVACIRAAEAAGEATPGVVQPDLSGWFTHSLPLFIHLLLLPLDRVVNFRVRRDALIEQMVWFLLRGLGLKDSAIDQHYGKEALALLR